MILAKLKEATKIQHSRLEMTVESVESARNGSEEQRNKTHE